MSFVDLMASDVWSDSDIDRRVQALIRSRYSENDELKAARMARTGEDPAFVAAVDAWIAECVQQGRDAQADMALLAQVFPLEEAHARLAQQSLTAAFNRLQQPVVEPALDEGGNVTNQEAIDQDQAERTAAQAVVDPYLIDDPADSQAPQILDPDAVVNDEAERAAAQAVVDAASPEATALYLQRL